MLTPSQHQRQKGRDQIAKVVRAMEFPSLSKGGERLVAGVIETAELQRSYESSGGSGLASFSATLDGMYRRVRLRRHALVRAAVRMGADPRTAVGYSRMLASPFAAQFPNTEIQARRWLRWLEVGETRRTRKAEGR
jgi:hypothetical protein